MNEERPIEKLLRRCAKKRRDEAGPPPELHPATRRLLQGEVGRQFSKSRPAGRTGFWAMLRVRWVYAAACASVVAVGTMLLLPSWRENKNASPLAHQEQEMSLAKATTLNDEQLPEEVLRKALPEDKESAIVPPALAAAPAVSLETVTTPAGVPRKEATQLSFEDRVARRLDEPPTVAPVPKAQPTDRYKSARETPAAPVQTDVNRLSIIQPEQAASRAPTLAERKAAPVGLAGASGDSVADKDLAVKENRPVAISPARVPASTAASDVRSRKTSLARGGGLEREDQATISQAFANLAPASSEGQKQKAAPSVPVLVNFRIEQNGDQWRVIDGDGSTYLGVSLPAADVTERVELKKVVVSPAESARAPFSARYGLSTGAQTAAKYFHRVEGTNRTLQQPVSFEWNFVAPTNAPGAITQSVGQAVQTPPLAPWVNSALNGQVQINTRTQFELNAAPVTR